jgi:putative tryptophan/tyrosine transport system substrate-binding protein
VNRRSFITLLGGAAAAWPLAARAQQSERMRTIGVLLGQSPANEEFKSALAKFAQGLQQSGWVEGRNMRFETRWAAGNPDDIRKYAAELVALGPDVILVAGSASVGPLLQATRSVPVVFTLVPDPVGAGYVDSLGRPGRNATGFTNFEYGVSGKWVELLKEMAPNVRRVAVLRDAALVAGTGQFGAIQAVAPSLGVEVSPINVTDGSEIERGVVSFAQSPNGGLIVTQSALALLHRELIIVLAARHKLAAIYINRVWSAAGGLLSYGAEPGDQFRRAAGYVDRILKGEKPGDLPVQAPIKYELVINLKTAKALGLEVPATLLARADEVIE